MQSVESRPQLIGNQRLTRAMAAFGTVVAIVLIVGALVYGAILGIGVLTPLLAPKAAIDPFAAPSLVQFRIDEHAEAAQGWTGDPFAAPSLVRFRIDEHADSAQQWHGDPFAAPNLVEFRQSEHAEAR
jgi:nitrogen fixation protein FixH